MFRLWFVNTTIIGYLKNGHKQCVAIYFGNHYIMFEKHINDRIMISSQIIDSNFCNKFTLLMHHQQYLNYMYDTLCYGCKSRNG